MKRRTNVVGILPNDAAIVQLMSSQLLGQQEEWQLGRRRFYSEATMAKIPETEETLELNDADPNHKARPLVSYNFSIPNIHPERTGKTRQCWMCIRTCPKS